MVSSSIASYDLVFYKSFNQIKIVFNRPLTNNYKITCPQTAIMKIIRNNKTKITALSCHVVFYGDAAEKKNRISSRKPERVEDNRQEDIIWFYPLRRRSLLSLSWRETQTATRTTCSHWHYYYQSSVCMTVGLLVVGNKQSNYCGFLLPFNTLHDIQYSFSLFRLSVILLRHRHLGIPRTMGIYVEQLAEMQLTWLLAGDYMGDYVITLRKYMHFIDWLMVEWCWMRRIAVFEVNIGLYIQL